MSFASLGLSDSILKAVTANGYDTPTPIQEQAIPAVISGKDVMGAAQTGTGKTAGFTLPLLERLSNGARAKSNHIRALVLTPTRELAAQVHQSVTTYGRNLPLSSVVVFGGVKINPQMMKLRKGVDILVATPGRLLDLHNQNAVNFSQVEVLVLDEADRMLDMGFIHDIKKILSKLPPKRQNLLFSATFSSEIRSLAKSMVNNPIEISVSPPNTTVDLVEQFIYPVDKGQKSALLTQLIKDGDWHQVLVFSRTKHGANKLTKQLNARGIVSAAIHGNKSQGARTKALQEFKDGKTSVLVATDIAARGIDIEELPYVVNFDLPNVSEDYVHRIGRTGRAGSSGQAVSLVSPDELKLLTGIEKLIQQVLTRKTIEGFELDRPLPETRLKPNTEPRRSKKSKKYNSQSSGSGRPNENRAQGNRRSGNEANGNSNRSSLRNQRSGNGNSPNASSGNRRSGNSSQTNGTTRDENFGNR